MHPQNHEFWYRVHLATRSFNHRFRIWCWLILVLLSCCLFVCTYYAVKVKTSNISNMEAAPSTTTATYDNEYQRADSPYLQKGSFVELSQISPYIQGAVIATEDRTSYENPGFSVKEMVKAAISSVIHHGIIGGSSTLTQQLTRNVLLAQK